MAATDVYGVTISSGFTGQIAEQIYFYEQANSAGGSGASDLAAEVIATLIPLIADVIQTDVPFVNVRTVCLFNAADWDDTNIGGAITGTRTGQAMPGFVVAAFKSAKPTSSQAPARKRFGNLSESDVQGNGLQDVSGYFTALNTLATGLGAALVGASSATYDPVIVKRIGYVTPGGKDAYRLPATLGECVTFPAINWTWSNVVTSQITRKIGRGT